ncbi:MAG: hypothetical protein ACK4F9_03410 [Brevinematia bacterium]
MRRVFYFLVILFVFFSVMIFSIVQREYYRSLCIQEKKLEKDIKSLEDEYKKIVYEIERLTTFENLVGKELSRYKVSLNRVILIADKN